MENLYAMPAGARHAHSTRLTAHVPAAYDCNIKASWGLDCRGGNTAVCCSPEQMHLGKKKFTLKSRHIENLIVIFGITQY